MRINTLVTLGASAAFGVMSIFLARGWINDAVSDQFADTPASPEFTAMSTIATMPVLVADMDLNFGDVLDAQMLRLVDMPNTMIPMGSFTDFSGLFGSSDERTVVLTQMRANEPVLDYKISGPGGRGSLSAVIKDGMRAASIRVNAVAGVGGFVLPGDHVDVTLTRDVATGEQERRLTSDVLLQNVKVLGADQNSDTTAGSARVVQTVTLEVSPRDAQRLSLAMDIGTLSLMLRQTGEMQINPIAAISENTLTAPAQIARKAGPYRSPFLSKQTRQSAPAETVAKVNIIRSGTTESVSVRKEITQTSKIKAPALEELAGADETGAKG